MSENLDERPFTKADNFMPENMDQHSSNSWDPILFTNADDSIFDRLHQHSFTEAET
jgi:hypothetical protein